MRNVWFCIVTEGNWPIVRDSGLYGVPETKNKRAYREICRVRVGDILVFYVRFPVRAIVGIYEASSEVFEERKLSPWKDRLYPYRIKIKPISEELKELSKPIPLKMIVGKVSAIRSSRSFMGRSIIPLTTEDFKFIKSLVEKGKK